MEIMDIQGMSGWPGTPGPGRLRAAEEELERDSRRDESRLDGGDAALEPAELDGRKLLGIMEFTGESTGELEQLGQAGFIQGPLDVARLALRGSGPDFVAAIIRTEQPGGNVPYRITRLFRDPEWVGLNHLLPGIRGHEVHIFTGRGDGEPELLVASGRWEAGWTSLAGPRGKLNAVLGEIAAWHGAAGSFWHGKLALAGLAQGG